MEENKLTLVVLAAGMGSRYGGLKQLDALGPNGEILLDYSFHDALEAGFDKIVCVIRPEMENAFQETITQKWEDRILIEHAYQKLDSLPSGFLLPKDRHKPWGTAHAILAAASSVSTPFAVINADDFYGRSSYSLMAQFLKESRPSIPHAYAMVSFLLENTLSKHGSVSRGVCQVSPERHLLGITERKNILSKDDTIVYQENQENFPISKGTQVSMNFWGFTPSIFSYLETGFEKFLKEQRGQDQQLEYPIPDVVDHLLKEKQASVSVLKSSEKWMGVTYREDKEHTKKGIAQLISLGVYPSQKVSVRGA